MPFLPDERSTDKLLKNLAIDLTNQIDGADLAKCGWFQYRDHDHPKTLVSTELASNAFLYLSFDAGSWKRNPKVVTAILAFMRRYYHVSPQQADLVRLRQLMEAQPLNPQAIIDWFHAMYPPDAAPK